MDRKQARGELGGGELAEISPLEEECELLLRRGEFGRFMDVVGLTQGSARRGEECSAALFWGC